MTYESHSLNYEELMVSAVLLYMNCSQPFTCFQHFTVCVCARARERAHVCVCVCFTCAKNLLAQCFAVLHALMPGMKQLLQTYNIYLTALTQALFYQTTLTQVSLIIYLIALHEDYHSSICPFSLQVESYISGGMQHKMEQLIYLNHSTKDKTHKNKQTYICGYCHRQE